MATRRFPYEVPEAIVRLVALQVVLIVALGFWLDASWVLGLLAVDFGLRALVSPRWSPLAALARTLAGPRLRGSERKVTYAPKRFAATMGFAFFTVATFLGPIQGFHTAAWAIGGMVAFLASLEAAFGLCVGCVIHQGLVRAGLLREPPCPTCTPSWPVDLVNRQTNA